MNHQEQLRELRARLRHVSSCADMEKTPSRRLGDYVREMDELTRQIKALEASEPNTTGGRPMSTIPVYLQYVLHLERYVEVEAESMEEAKVIVKRMIMEGKVQPPSYTERLDDWTEVTDLPNARSHFIFNHQRIAGHLAQETTIDTLTGPFSWTLAEGTVVKIVYENEDWQLFRVTRTVDLQEHARHYKALHEFGGDAWIEAVFEDGILDWICASTEPYCEACEADEDFEHDYEFTIIVGPDDYRIGGKDVPDSVG